MYLPYRIASILEYRLGFVLEGSEGFRIADNGADMPIEHCQDQVH